MFQSITADKYGFDIQIFYKIIKKFSKSNSTCNACGFFKHLNHNCYFKYKLSTTSALPLHTQNRVKIFESL